MINTLLKCLTPGISLVTSLIVSLFSLGQSFANLDFEKRCDSSKTGFCEWKLSWGTSKAVIPGTALKNNYLLIKGDQDQSVGFAEQEKFIQKVDGLRILKVTARIRSINVIVRGAGINVGIYDSTGLLISTRDMGGFYSLKWVKGTKDWKTYSIEIVCPEETHKIKIGAILYGKGEAGFDNYTVSLISVKGRKPSKLARQYINAVIDTIAKHSLVRDSINILDLQSKAWEIAGNASTYRDCHLAVSYLLESLRPYGDHHSFLMSPEEVKNWKNATDPDGGIEFCKYKKIGDFGYVTVPPFHGGNIKLMKAYSDSLHLALRKLEDMHIKGWIIDLRQNTGGNMTPMIAGLGPLFDVEKVGSLVDVEGNRQSWYYKNGHYIWESDTILSVPHPVKLRSKLPIAVLISSKTGSSGEIVVISFISNHKTKLFGEPTWGLTTGNGAFDLPDGARMMMASTEMADRNGKLYRGRIEPDEKVEASSNGNDKVLYAAIDWLSKE